MTITNNDVSDAKIRFTNLTRFGATLAISVTVVEQKRWHRKIYRKFNTFITTTTDSQM